MIQTRRSVKLLGLAGALCALIVSGMARAQVTVNPTVTPNGSLFHYDYCINDGTSSDLALVTIGVAQNDPNAVMNLTVPSGFKSNFDPGFGLVDFIGDTQSFTAGQTFCGFDFDSPIRPQPSSFTAFDVTGKSFAGPTLAPTPEPGSTTLLLALGASGTLFLRRRVRRL